MKRTEIFKLVIRAAELFIDIMETITQWLAENQVQPDESHAGEQ